jgi:alpha-beta hydrolase superfamily lysophospholipase
VATSVALLHGGGTSARQWDLVAARMAAPVPALDVPGRGDRPATWRRSPWGRHWTASRRTWAARRASQSGEPVVLVAHSSGGLLVPGIVDRLGGRVRRKLPCCYLMTVLDSAVPPGMQKVMAGRVTDAIVPLASGHLPHVTMPEVIAALCDGAAADVDRGEQR